MSNNALSAWANNPGMMQYLQQNPNNTIAKWYQQNGGVGVPAFGMGANSTGPIAPAPNNAVAIGGTSSVATPLPTAGANNNPDDPFAQSFVTPPNPAGINMRDTVLGRITGRTQTYRVPIFLPGTQTTSDSHGVLGAPETYRMGGWGAGAPPDQTPRQYEATSFAAGGMMSPQGQAIRPGAGMSAIPPDEPQMGADAPTPLTPQQIEQEANRLVQTQPQVIQQIQAMLVQGMQSGELNPNELNLAVQLAKTALANPATYPQVRQFAIQNGLGTEADIPQQIDQGLLLALLVAGKAMQSAGATKASPGQGNAMAGQKPAGILPEYSDGGMTGEKKHLAVLHPREYVIPEDALIYHGKKHYDKLVEQARTPPDANKT